MRPRGVRSSDDLPMVRDLKIESVLLTMCRESRSRERRGSSPRPLDQRLSQLNRIERRTIGGESSLKRSAEHCGRLPDGLVLVPMGDLHFQTSRSSIDLKRKSGIAACKCCGHGINFNRRSFTLGR